MLNLLPFKTNMKFAKCFLVLFALCILRNAESAPNGKDKESTTAASRKGLLYPVDDVKDRVNFTNADKPFEERQLSINLTFFRHRLHPTSNLRIFPYGFISLNRTEGPHDEQIIAAFLLPQNISTVKGSGVFLKVLKIEEHSNDELSQRLRNDFRQGMIGASDFNPKNAIIVTWRNMSIATSNKTTKNTNTYQLVLATDGKERTYLMLNYDHLERITEDIAKRIFVGFTSEYNRSYSYPTYSQSPQITRLASTGYGNGLPGRHYFQVDDQIFRGTCLEKRYDTLNASRHLPLTFFPRRGNMLGGHEINVTGPCFQPQSKIVCRFGKLATVPGIYRDINHATCVAPFLSHHGYIELSVSVGGNNLTNFTGNYCVQSPELADEDVRIEQEEALKSYPSAILIVRWNATKIPTTSRRVGLALWGVTKESGSLRLKYIDQISSRPIPQHIDKYEINVREEFANRWNPGTQNLTFGFLSVNFSSEGLEKSDRALWSRPMPLAWYFTPQWKKMYADEVNETFCKIWANEEKNLPPVNATLPPCPCTAKQAELNIAHFMPHDKCNAVERRCGPGHGIYAYQCFELATTSRAGSSQTCCYDDYGELIRSADTLYSGRVRRASPFGKEPFSGVNNVPGLSMWYRDIMPFFFCAEWSADKDSESTQTYEKLRPSKDCTSYKPPTVGSVFGDPHFKTFNGLSYTFNGLGEFVLVRDERPFENLDIQGRFVQVQQPYRGGVKASYLSAVVARSNKSATVEFRIRPYTASLRYQMDVIVDKNYVTFSNESRPFLYFKGVTLHQPLGVRNMSTVIATFDTGVGIRVQAVGHENLAVNVVLDQSYKNHTKGLLGNYGKEDFTLPNGSVALPSTANARDIHYKFAQKWRLTERYQKNIGSSLFYHDTLKWSYYNDVNFTADIFDTRPTDLPSVISDVCGDSFPCSYDFFLTKNRNIALNTLTQHRIAETMFRHSRMVDIRCPALPRPAHGRKSVVFYFIGTSVEFSCDPGYTLHGTAVRVCRDTGTWSPGTPAVCKRNN